MRNDSSRVKIEIDLSDLDLGDLVEFVHATVSGPGDVFDDDELGEWAKKHGWLDFGDEE